MSDATLGSANVPRWLDRAVAWVKDRERPLLGMAVALQVVVLAGMIGIRAMPLVTGDTVLLRVQPVDPRDLFRGDYVILSYDVSRVPPGGIEGLSFADRRESERQTVYVTLVPEDDGLHWRADKWTIHQPTSGKYLRGTLAGWDRIEFGIESYYVQEGEGHRYEDAARRHRLSAEVAVAPTGQAALRGLRVE